MRLSEVAPMIRKGIVITIVFVFSYTMVTVVALPLLRGTFAALFPGKDAPTVKFGQLDALQFVEKPITNPDPEYILNTQTGRLPALAKQLPVYKLTGSSFSYADGKNAQSHATLLGFSETDLISDLKGEIYRWKSPVSQGILEISIHSKELILNTPLEGRATSFGRGGFTDAVVKQQAVALFKSLGRFNDKSYESGTQKVLYGRYAGTRVVPAETINTAQLARVDLNRKIGDYLVLGPDPEKGLLHVVISSPTLRSAPVYTYPVVEAYYHGVDSVIDATYPLITVNQAWNAVKKGDGVISSVVPNGSSPFEPYAPVAVQRIYVNNVYLAYYEDTKPTGFLQPIYVFDGNYITDGGTKGGIKIYYPAVSGKWIKPIPSQNSEESN